MYILEEDSIGVYLNLLRWFMQGLRKIVLGAHSRSETRFQVCKSFDFVNM